MVRTRLYQKPGSTPVSGPKTTNGWHALLERAIERASITKDRRLAGLYRARVDGPAATEKVLRMMGIVSEVDLQREFPDQTDPT